MSIECYKNRFGIICVEKGFINVEQLIEAVSQQIRDDIHGKRHRLIGTVLFEMGYMDTKQVDEVLRSMAISTPDPLGRVV